MHNNVQNKGPEVAATTSQTHIKSISAKRSTKSELKATVYADGERQPIVVKGRYAQTLNALVTSSSTGITALEVSSWALRLAHYVFILRTKYGLHIEMERETHEIDGVIGWHGRYFLLSHVELP